MSVPVRFLHDDKPVDKTNASAVKMQVMALGLPRCGTSSLQAAFESDVLNFSPCIHMARIAPYGDRMQTMLAAQKEPDRHKRQKILRSLYDGYAATTDVPGAFFPDDLMDIFPDAAIILNQRENGTVWEKSFYDSLGFLMTRSCYYSNIMYASQRVGYWMYPVAFKHSEKQFGMKRWNADFYDKYNAWVLDEARKRGRKVLVWKVGDGWAPLCEFLGKPEPMDGTSFPKRNEAAEMRFIRNVVYARGIVTWMAILGLGWAILRFAPAALSAARGTGSKWL
jgi:hypothetical protein